MIDNVEIMPHRNFFISLFFSFNGDGVLICSIDNMPTQIPTEATEYFGNLLLPYVPDFVSIFASNLKVNVLKCC